MDDNKASDSCFEMSEVFRMFESAKEARARYKEGSGEIIPPNFSSVEDYIEHALKPLAEGLHGDVVVTDEQGNELKDMRFRGGLKKFKPKAK